MNTTTAPKMTPALAQHELDRRAGKVDRDDRRHGYRLGGAELRALASRQAQAKAAVAKVEPKPVNVRAQTLKAVQAAAMALAADGQRVKAGIQARKAWIAANPE